MKSRVESERENRIVRNKTVEKGKELHTRTHTLKAIEVFLSIYPSLLDLISLPCRFAYLTVTKSQPSFKRENVKVML